MAGISTVSSQGQAAARGQLFEIGDIAHAPFGVTLAQAGVEHRVAERGMLAVALERTIEKQPPVGAQIARGAGEQAFGDAPRRDVDDVGAEHRQQFFGPTAVLHQRMPRPDRTGRSAAAGGCSARPECARQASMLLQMRLVEVARPPGDVGAMAGEMHHMLAGAAAGLQHVAGFARRGTSPAPPRSAGGCDGTPPHRAGRRARPAGHPCRTPRRTRPRHSPAPPL